MHEDWPPSPQGADDMLKTISVVQAYLNLRWFISIHALFNVCLYEWGLTLSAFFWTSWRSCFSLSSFCSSATSFVCKKNDNKIWVHLVGWSYADSSTEEASQLPLPELGFYLVSDTLILVSPPSPAEFHCESCLAADSAVKTWQMKNMGLSMSLQ